MDFIRKLGLSIVTSLFSTLLVVFAVSVAMYFVLDTPGTIKNALRESGIYNVFIDKTLPSQRSDITELAQADPGVKQAIESAFPPSYLQANTEHTIDTTYDWLHGTTQTPSYGIDLTQPKQVFADNIAGLVKQRAANLPACSSITSVPGTAAEILALTCRPLGETSDTLAAAARERVLTNGVFETIAQPINNSNQDTQQRLTHDLRYIPEAHHYYILSLFIVPAVLLLFAVAIIFWSISKRAGIRHIAWSLCVTGLTTALLAFVAVWAFRYFSGVVSNNGVALANVQEPVRIAVNLVSTQLRNWLIGVGGAYILAAIILWVVLRLSRSSKKKLRHIQDLNREMEYSSSVPAAGTTFDPGDKDKPETQEAPSTGTPPRQQHDHAEGRPPRRVM
jgi:hypothetical protein